MTTPGRGISRVLPPFTGTPRDPSPRTRFLTQSRATDPRRIPGLPNDREDCQVTRALTFTSETISLTRLRETQAQLVELPLSGPEPGVLPLDDPPATAHRHSAVQLVRDLLRRAFRDCSRRRRLSTIPCSSYPADTVVRCSGALGSQRFEVSPWPTIGSLTSEVAVLWVDI
jgi:hypothetical protein